MLEKVKTVVERYDAVNLFRSFTLPVRIKLILSSVSKNCFLAHVELDKEVLLLGIKFCDQAKRKQNNNRLHERTF